MIGPLLLGLVLGALGAWMQIRVTRWRVHLALRGFSRLALVAFPLALLGPAAAALACAALAAPALGAWALAWTACRTLLLRMEVWR